MNAVLDALRQARVARRSKPAASIRPRGIRVCRIDSFQLHSFAELGLESGAKSLLRIRKSGARVNYLRGAGK
ncbi:MAG: hypothetical protein WA373_16735 [Burkholderiales bacterium]